ncbi:alpha/beta hydrolase [Mycolicibacterium cosmeticum]|uniref:Dipeptidyl aminopeptidase/ acylaminoacyl-peptidase-like protein n=1 Tax=Mycolicibacterium cosmeticum TaxID=258533 RepID=W9B8X7_MYCCO|nr:alpha/beta hydrolase [Mycolicibacterium cosmeticum]TLH74144.1 alpha/beta hydrolase [Mycolicibacterium cosmeticum]CDO11096.1 dipeptidyl aminopeptidase/ acylaminoacyl-peptidase-like protein [Mycolicibacterium cosmeticum]
MAEASLLQKLAVTMCAVTGSTDVAARWAGAAPFLPALFVLRYANMGGLDHALFAAQIRGARSFRDDRWCGYWNSIADAHARRASDMLRSLAGADSAAVPDLTDPNAATATGHVERLAAWIAPAAVLFADHGPQPDAPGLTALVDEHAPAGDRDHIRLAYQAIDAWVKAITYYQVCAFPGHAPHRMRAYWHSRHLFDALIGALAPTLGLTVEHVDIPVAGGDAVRGYLVVPPGSGPHPVVLTTNGLEGTVQELAIPQLRYRNSGMAMFLMEMPGSYAYTDRMRPESEAFYHQVIDHLAADRRLAPDRIAMVGVSFGGYWTARLAATNDRLACAIACGAPTHRSFHGGALGIPQIILHALAETVGAVHPIDLMSKLRALSIRDLYRDITIPLLVINGDHDTLMSTQDSSDLAHAAADATLLLYPDDDHCAMGHYRQWLDRSQQWLLDHLAVTAR